MHLVEFDKHTWMFEFPEISEQMEDSFDEALNAWSNEENDIAESILKNLVTRCPTFIDAIHHLSLIFDDTKRVFESYLCSREAVRVGLEVIPDQFDWGKDKIEWTFLSNRPFLRAYHGLGLYHYHNRNQDEAIKIFRELINICPNDNLGARRLLPKLWFESGDMLSIIRLCKAYGDDTSPEILYSLPLAFSIMGEPKKAQRYLVEAKNIMPIIIKELKKKRHTKPKSKPTGMVIRGGAGQAYNYWKEYGQYWEGNLTALSLIEKIKI